MKARLLSLLAAALPSACASVEGAPAGDQRPNVVLVLADDLGWGDPRCYSPESRVPTPHIDRLAREGMRFTDAHAAGSVCVPSRFGLLTGSYPFRAERLNWRAGPVIADGQPTVASLLKTAGYATAMVGKWHQGFAGSLTDGSELHGGPVDRGFDRFVGLHASLDIPPYFWIRDRTPLAAPTELVEASHTEGWSDIQGAFWRGGAAAPGFDFDDVLPRFQREAVAYVEERAEMEKPFFLYVALTGPHTPWLPAEEFRGASGAGLYGDFVAHVDATLGAILAALDETGQADDTLVLFTSDNGPVWYLADAERFGHASTGPFRGMKADAWEGGHRVPFVVRWPGRVEPGAVSDRLVCFTDVFPTLADVAGLAMPAVVGDGHSLYPAFVDPDAASPRSSLVLKRDASVVRMGRWKLITHLGSGGFSAPRKEEPAPDGPRGQLYDLDADPGETTNLWSERPEVVAELTRVLEATR